VGVDHRAKALPGVADGGDAVGMRTLAGAEAEAGDAGELGTADLEAAVARDARAEQRGGARGVSADQVEDETLEVLGLADVH
jgi:hypothetical protein